MIEDRVVSPEYIENEEEQKAFDEELYEKFINNENLKFSKDDVEKIEKLLNSEISDETIKNNLCKSNENE